MALKSGGMREQTAAYAYYTHTISIHTIYTHPTLFLYVIQGIPPLNPEQRAGGSMIPTLPIGNVGNARIV